MTNEEPNYAKIGKYINNREAEWRQLILLIDATMADVINWTHGVNIMTTPMEPSPCMDCTSNGSEIRKW